MLGLSEHVGVKPKHYTVRSTCWDCGGPTRHAVTSTHVLIACVYCGHQWRVRDEACYCEADLDGDQLVAIECKTCEEREEIT